MTETGQLITSEAGKMPENHVIQNGPIITNNNSTPPTTTTSTSSSSGISTLITINISGQRYQTPSETLERYPDSLLGNKTKRAAFLRKTNEYYFERHRPSFDAILYFYQTNGYLKRPSSVPPAVFEREIKFFELGSRALDTFWEREGAASYKAPQLPHSRLKRILWQFIEHPDSSLGARVIAILSILFIVISTTSFCLETTELQEPYRCQVRENVTEVDPLACSTWDNPFFIVESLCIIWFTFEFVIRFVSCPSKRKFARSFLNWVDIVAVAPFYVSFVLREGGFATSLAILRIFRLVRVFRIFKLSRHSRGLQVLGKTISASVQELCLLVFFLLITLILSGSAIYYAESAIPDSKFTSIPASFWYGIVTLTTVGYGDMYPQTPLGKVVGGVCAIVGVLVLALPVTVIVSNFKRFYEQEIQLANLRQDDELYEPIDTPENAVEENNKP